MVRPIIIARMSCIGELSRRGYFHNPSVEIKVDPDDNSDDTTGDVLKYEIDVMFGELILRIPTMYREASRKLDEPTFKMTAYDEHGRELGTIGDRFDRYWPRDTFYHFDTQDSVIDFKILKDQVAEGEERTFTFELESMLEQWEWRGRRHKGEQLETLSETKTMTVKVTVDKIVDVYFNSFCSGKYMKDKYYVVVDIDNMRSDSFDYTLYCTEWEGNMFDAIPLYEMHSDGTLIPAGGSLSPGKHRFVSNALVKDWIWWEEEIGFMKIIEPRYQTFEYAFTLTLGELSGTDKFSKDISVPLEKIEMAEEANKWWGKAIIYYVLATAWVIAAAASCGLPCAALAAYYGLEGYFCQIIAGDWKDKAKNRCAIEFDPEYTEIYDYKKKIQKIKIRHEHSLEGQALSDILSKLAALNKGIDKTYERYLSALREKQRKVASHHMKNASHMLSLMEKEISALKSELTEFKEYVSGIDLADKNSYLKKAIDEVKEKGLTETQIDDLSDVGFTEEEVAEIERIVKNLIPEEIDVKADIDDAYQKTLTVHQYGNETVREMERIHSLSEVDKKMELLKTGLISLAEFHGSRDKRDYETDYLIANVSWLEQFNKERLINAGIMSTKDLIRRCKSSRKMRAFSKKKGIPLGLLKKWVSLTRFMQLKGLGDEHSELLFEAGITDIAQLSKASPDRLLKKIAKHKDRRRFKKRMPTKDKISKWKVLAKELMTAEDEME